MFVRGSSAGGFSSVSGNILTTDCLVLALSKSKMVLLKIDRLSYLVK